MSNDMDREACVTPVAAFTEAGNGSTQLRISMDKHTRNSEKFISSHESLPSSIKRAKAPEEGLYFLLVDCTSLAVHCSVVGLREVSERAGSSEPDRGGSGQARSNGKQANQTEEAAHRHDHMLNRLHQHLAGSSARWKPTSSGRAPINT